MNWIKDTDSRYAGVYWLNRDGVSISGTNKNFHHCYLIEQNDMEHAVKTQKAVVAGTKELYNAHFNYLSIFAPILDQDRKSARVFYWHISGWIIWKKILKMLSPGHTFILETKRQNPNFRYKCRGIQWTFNMGGCSFDRSRLDTVRQSARQD
ncbi:hypothetical protein RCO48_29820 [Peribacillus frigoritolerans]|nr:hypothetical protein [Peribacillus frigoritolerans]